MATTFLEPGGDANFLVTATNGFWSAVVSPGGPLPTVATDFVHGGHKKSIELDCQDATYSQQITSTIGSLSDAGSRISLYIYIASIDAVATNYQLFSLLNSSGTILVSLKITNAGVLQLWNASTAQIGTNGATLSTGQWYRISLAYTITSTLVNRFELFVGGVSSISVTNATVTTIVTNKLKIGNASANGDISTRISDVYIDNSNSLTDTGDIWVTAKRPVSNGTTNGFTTQIGSGGSGYGSGHSPQVNERPLSTTNGWSMVGAGSAVTEEYNIEAKNVGDIDISQATLKGLMGWVSASSLVGETAQLIYQGSGINISLTSTPTLFTAYDLLTNYPVGGTDIGLKTDTSLTTVSLYECGVLVAYIPVLPASITGISSMTGVSTITL